MKPVYIDLHIHTSDDPSNLNQYYDLDTLVKKVKEISNREEFLISFTDHNTINEKAYLEAVEKIKSNLILGVELHIQAHKGENTKAYHCHIYFNLEKTGITSEVIKKINTILNKLYPDKKPKLTDSNIPYVQDIIEAFDEFDFLLLPHGGQTHATFDEAMPQGREFDNAMQRSIYYNFFDGFTSRSDKKTEKTKEYLKRLGVEEFTNLITCTDNYNPEIYPKPKQKETYEFIPTWMFATPSFEGLRLSLSDSSRLIHSNDVPRSWQDSIKSIKLHNEHIDIDVQLTPGLNVIIGESSGGKTLLVDSLVRKITQNTFDDSKYINFGVEAIEVNYPENLHPHFIEQNYVTSVTTENKVIKDIPIISKILPENTEARKLIDRGKRSLNDCLAALFRVVEKVEILETEIHRIPILSSLISSEDTQENVLKGFLSTITKLKNVEYSAHDQNSDLDYLDSLEERLSNNPFITHDNKLIESLKHEIKEMRAYAELEGSVSQVVKKRKKKLDEVLKEKEGESQKRKQDFELLLVKMKDYFDCLLEFDEILNKIATFSIEATSDSVVIEGYVLSVENKFKLNKGIVVDEFNKLLLKDKQLANFESITPQSLYKDNFKNNLPGSQRSSKLTYKVIQDNINANIIENDDIKYRIFTQAGEDFETLSPGRKTAIILHLILNFDGDNAPLIIDQPEDNLATSYMNDGLIKSIKKMKSKKQIIFVSHNATIPMAGDAQNIILCQNTGNKIEIRSSPLEGSINGITVVDHIAKIADGGKPSIKKRFKKYNLKKYNN